MDALTEQTLAGFSAAERAQLTAALRRIHATGRPAERSLSRGRCRARQWNQCAGRRRGYMRSNGSG